VRLTYFLFLILLSCSQLPTKNTNKLSILQGITNSKEVEFSVVTKKGRSLRFELRNYDGLVIAPDETKIVSKDYSDIAVYKIVFIRDQVKDYNLYVYEGEKIVDQRLVGHGIRQESHLKIAVTSSSNDYYKKNFKIWDTLLQKNPDYVLMLGDNVVADASSLTTIQSVTPEVLWKRYTDVRLTLPIFFNQKLIPVHAMWNDHDLAPSDMEASKDIFEAFYAQDLSDDDWVKSNGVGGVLSLGDFNLYFLDGRSYRSKNRDGSHLGLDQTAWFYSKLREMETPSLIIKGDQFFGGYHGGDSFQGQHTDNFHEFATELSKIETPFVFLSGDRGMSEIMQFPRSLFGKPSFEITSSPIHAKALDTEDKNPWRVVGESGRMNFVLIDNVAKDNHWFMEVESVGENGETYFKRELAVYIKDLQNNLNEARKRRYGKRRYQRSKTRRSRR
jgi:hypothetical protein